MWWQPKAKRLFSNSWLVLLLAILVFSTQIQAKERKLLILGDSLSAAYGMQQAQGWVSLLQNALKDQQIHVVNAAISGETTDGGLARLPRLLDQHHPSHLLIELGGNDGLQGHSIKKMRANLQAMIELAKDQNVQVILQEMQIPTNYGRRYNQMFTGSYHKLAEQNQLPLIPFFLSEIALNPKLMMPDGIHPNEAAQAQIAKWMQQQLIPYLQDESPAKSQAN